MNDNTGLLPKWAYNQGNLLLGAVALTVAVVAWVQNPQQKNELANQRLELLFAQQQERSEQLSKQIQNLKDNDLHTVEGHLNDIGTTQQELAKQLAVMQAILMRIDQRTGGR